MQICGVSSTHETRRLAIGGGAKRMYEVREVATGVTWPAAILLAIGLANR